MNKGSFIERTVAFFPFGGKISGKRAGAARKFMLVYAAAAACIVYGALLFYARYKTALIHESGEQLKSIAVFKIAEISDWALERESDTLSLTDSPVLSKYIAAFAANPADSELRSLLKARLENYLKHNAHYFAAALMDAGGRPLITAGEPSVGLQPEEARALSLAAAKKAAVLSDLYRPAGGGRPRLCVVAPAAATRPVVLYLRLLIDPEVFLFPRIKLWPVKSASGETLLVRGEAGGILFLNRVRYRNDAPLTFKLQGAAEKLPAAMALRGHKGVVKSIDYRGVKVLAYVDSIPATGWGMVVKMDMAEVLAPARTTGLLLLALGLSVLAGAGGWLFLLAKRGEAELALSEDKFRLFFENSAVGKSITGIDGSIIVNRALCGMLGYSAEELGSKKWQDLTRPEDIKATADIMREMLTGQRGAVRYEKRFIHKTGRVVDAEISSVILRDAAGKPEYFITSTNDISARKQAEAALRASEARYREMVESAVDGILTGAPDGKITGANSRMQQLAGRPLEKLIGLHAADLFDPEELASNPLNFDLLKNGRTLISERSLLRPDGTKLPVEMHSKMLPGGTFQSIYRDITERRREQEAQGRFELLFRNNPAPMALSTVPGRKFYDVNNSFLRVLGYSRDEIIGKTSAGLGLFVNKGQQMVMEDKLRTEGNISGLEQQVRTRSGALLFGLFSGDIVSIQGRQYYLTVMTDFTERRKLEQDKERLNATLVEKNQEMENFLYITTHDLRNPLLNIQGFGQNLEKYTKELREALAPAPLPPEGRLAVDKLTGEKIPMALRFMLDSSNSMDSLINALLKVSRLGRLEMKPETVDMNKLCGEIKGILRYQLEDAGGKIKLGPLPPCKADPIAVKHIFANLLDNALKYRHKERAAEVSVSGEVKDGRAIYAVADNGAGIPAEDLHNIWDVFYRGGKAPVSKGEGIGLTMAKRLVEKNGGAIRAESKEGAGTVFYVELPGVEEK